MDPVSFEPPSLHGMEPVPTLEQLLYELRSVNAQTLEIPVAKLTPGCVIASTRWDRHIVTAPPTRLNSHTETMVVPVRHLHGGHSLRVIVKEPRIKIYRVRMHRPTGGEVPVVPPCIVPDSPATGDRIVLQYDEANSLGTAVSYEYTGRKWQHTSITDKGLVQAKAYPTSTVKAFVKTTTDVNWHGWHAYLPAGHRPHLYADGRPVPARLAEELQEGDVVLVPGGGRLQLEAVVRHADGTTMRLRTLQSSRHLLRHLTWASIPGDLIEAHDSGLRGVLYATEPRPSELISAADLYPGDTVIAAWGTPYSHVATVEEMYRPALRPGVHVHSVTPDGRQVRTQTGLDNRYYLLQESPRRASALDFRRSALAEYALEC